MDLHQRVTLDFQFFYALEIECFEKLLSWILNQVQDDSLFVQDDSLFVQDDSLFVQDDNLFVQDDSLFVQDDSLFVQDDSLFSMARIRHSVLDTESSL